MVLVLRFELSLSVQVGGWMRCTLPRRPRSLVLERVHSSDCMHLNPSTVQPRAGPKAGKAGSEETLNLGHCGGIILRGDF